MNSIRRLLPVIGMLSLLCACGKSDSAPGSVSVVASPESGTAAPVAAKIPEAGPALSEAGFSCRLETLTTPKGYKAGGPDQSVKVRLTNTSKETWPAFRDGVSELMAVGAASHWLNSKSEWIAEGRRTYLAMPLAPGESVELDVVIGMLPDAGKFELKLEPIQEGRAWFSTMNGCSKSLTVDIAR